MGRVLPLAFGLTALLSTMTIICVDAIIATHIHANSPARKTSIAAAVLEGILWIVLGCMTIEVVMAPSKTFLKSLSSRSSGIAFGCATIISVVATVLSVANIICLGQASKDFDNSDFGASKDQLLTTSSVFVGLSILCQVIFLTSFFVTSRKANLDESGSSRAIDRVGSVKSLESTPSFELEKQWPQSQSYYNTPAPYSHTRPTTADTVGGRSFYSQATDTVSLMGRNRSNSWDRYSVHSRGPSTDMSSHQPPRPTFLETIPASPTSVRNTEVEVSLADLQPPPPVAYEDDRGRNRNNRSAESHIHPLFRSDSPNPPPIASVGTRVDAAPDAGRVIQNWSSNLSQARSMRRVHSNGSRVSTLTGMSMSNRSESREVSYASRDSTSDADDGEAKESVEIPDYVRRYTMMQL